MRTRLGLIAPALALVPLSGCSLNEAAPTASTAETSSAVAVPTQPDPEGHKCPNPHGGTCLGPLKAGDYRTSIFKPELTYSVPAGWTNFEDLPGNFWLFQQNDSQDGAVGGSYLGIYQNVNAAAINCVETNQKGIGTTPKDLVAWYQSVPGLIISKPRPVTVGGLDGLQIDLSLKPGVDTCQYGPYAGTPLIIGNGVSQLHHALLEELDVRLVILGREEGNVTLEITNVKEQHSAEQFRSALQPILDSMEFTK